MKINELIRWFDRINLSDEIILLHRWRSTLQKITDYLWLDTRKEEDSTFNRVMVMQLERNYRNFFYNKRIRNI